MQNDVVIDKIIHKIVIDTHGYQHFMRNCDLIKGNALLKKNILKNLGYEYIYIPIFEWYLLDENSKKNYLKD